MKITSSSPDVTTTVPALVLLQQNQRLEGFVHFTTLIDCKSLVLTNRKQSSVGTEGKAFNQAFEVELPHHEAAVKIEERRMTSEIYREKKGVIGRQDENSVVMWVLKGENGGAIFMKIDLLDCIGDCRVEIVPSEDAVAR